MEIVYESAQVIQNEIRWFERVVDTALTLYFQNESEHESVYAHQSPDLGDSQVPYAEVIRLLELTFEERILLILALIPHVKPQCLDVFLIKNQNLDCEFSEFGGIKSNSRHGFLPTLETACFILGGSELTARFTFLSVVNKSHVLYQRGILDYDSELEFGLNHPLILSNEYLGLFTTGKKHLPQYSTKFPAKEITTKLDWEDLIVDQNVMEDLAEIKDWLLHSDLILNDWKLDRTLKPGFRVLFYGPPGTGKTMAASLLGKATGRPVFRVDLSMVVSKYIGETEKNLGKLFDEAEHKDWILFFDEADALFGKRTSTKGANDRYANQEVAYLLQRIEDFTGLVVLATNIQTNIDEAFSRRFQSMVHFPKPGRKERKMLWES
ncbi:MAG: ATP-binding protein, partial [Flavobacteriales bacterium]|nr:ATP-binding protein [Flavobacteriales bacterium]